MSQRTSLSCSAFRFNRNPMTPIRRIFNFEPVACLGKRHRKTKSDSTCDYARPYSTCDRHPNAMAEPQVPMSAPTTLATVDSSWSFRPRRASATSCMPSAVRPASIALQNHDFPLDAVVITTLPSAPFRCHEDLLRMQCDELLAVACSLNAHLPASMQISVGPGQSEADKQFILRQIESVVGLRKEVPAAPRMMKRAGLGTRYKATCNAHDKENRWHTDGDGDYRMVDSDVETDMSPPTSPLAMRGISLMKKNRHLRTVAALDNQALLKLANIALQSPRAIGLEYIYEDEECYSDDVLESEWVVKKRRISPPETRLGSSIKSNTPSASSSFFLSRTRPREDDSPPPSRVLRRTHTQRQLRNNTRPLPTKSSTQSSIDRSFVKTKLRYQPCRGVILPSSSSSPSSAIDTAFINTKPRYRVHSHVTYEPETLLSPQHASTQFAFHESHVRASSSGERMQVDQSGMEEYPAALACTAAVLQSDSLMMDLDDEQPTRDVQVNPSWPSLHLARDAGWNACTRELFYDDSMEIF